MTDVRVRDRLLENQVVQDIEREIKTGAIKWPILFSRWMPA